MADGWDVAPAPPSSTEVDSLATDVAGITLDAIPGLPVYPADWTGTGVAVRAVAPGLTAACLPPRSVTWLTPANLLGGDAGTDRVLENTARWATLAISAGNLSTVTDTTSTLWNASARSAAALQLARPLQVSPGRRVFACARITRALPTGTSGESTSIMLRAGSDYARMGLGSNGTVTRAVFAADGVFTNPDLSADDLIMWCAVEVSADSAQGWYCLSSASTPPTSGWVRVDSASDFTFEDTLTVMVVSICTGTTVSATVGPVWTGSCAVSDVTDTDDWPGALLIWDGLSSADVATSQDTLTVQRAIPAGLSVSSADVRAAIAGALATGNGYTPDVEARWRRGAAPSGAWAALASAASEGGATGDLYLELRPAAASVAYCLGVLPLVLRTGRA